MRRSPLELLNQNENQNLDQNHVQNLDQNLDQNLNQNLNQKLDQNQRQHPQERRTVQVEGGSQSVVHPVSGHVTSRMWSVQDSVLGGASVPLVNQFGTTTNVSAPPVVLLVSLLSFF